jgi:predicted PurR-regulated permease PerM
MNLLSAAIPPDPMALEYRIGFMQQVSGHSILLFLGIAMVVYGSLGQRALSRYLALACLMTGVLFLLSGVIVIRDGLVLQGQTLSNIESEATEIRSQMQTAQVNPNLPPDVTPQRIEEALGQLDAQAEALSQNARNSTTQAMMSVFSTQIVIGLGLLALGRTSIKHSH